MSKKSVKRSRMSHGATDDVSPTAPGPAIQSAAAQAAPAKSTDVAASASPRGPTNRRADLSLLGVDRASASMSSSAPPPTAKNGERARAISMGAYGASLAATAGRSGLALGDSGRAASSRIGPV